MWVSLQELTTNTGGIIWIAKSFNENSSTHISAVNSTMPYIHWLSKCVDIELIDWCALQLIKADFDQMKIPILEQYLTGRSKAEIDPL